MARPEPMNATPQHPKAKVSVQFSDPFFVAGEHITGKMEFECRADKGMGVSIIKAELFAIQELMSRDHSATSTFLHLTQCFQGPGLPPSNAVYPYPLPGAEPLPADHYPARKGITSFFFRFRTPHSTPSSIDFGKGLAKLKYEVRVSVGISWRNELQLVMDRKEIDIVEGPGEPSSRVERVIVGENGKLWVQGRILNTYVVAGQSACVELFVKNHSSKKTNSLSLSLTRHLNLPSAHHSSKPLQISDTISDVAFRGPEYIVQSGTEGVAKLVFDVPKTAHGVRTGRFECGDVDVHREMDSLFDVQCFINIKIGMGIGSKDVILSLPVTIVHPAAVPTPAFDWASSPAPYNPVISYETSVYPIRSPPPPEPYFQRYAPRAMSPPWSPSPQPVYAAHNQYYYYHPPPQAVSLPHPILRPSSADPFIAQQLPAMPPQKQMLDVEPMLSPESVYPAEGEVGKGERASRISAHLRMSSRNRSVSPQSHRFPTGPASVDLQPPHLNDVEGISPSSAYLLVPDGIKRSPASSIATSRQNTELLSPRPIISPKNSFSISQGTVKSDHVVDLERMAAEDIVADEIDVKEPSPERYLLPGSETPETPKLPPEPILAPVRSRPEIWNRESGLEALERKLLEQVGTRKPESMRRPDVRTILPITIPSPNDPRCDPPNDSAISSLALGAEVLQDRESLRHGSLSGLLDEKRLPSPPVYLEPDQDSIEEQRGRPKAKVKRSGVHQLRKAAAGRVNAWLGGIEDAPPPPECETPETSMSRVRGSKDGDLQMEDLEESPAPTPPPLPSKGNINIKIAESEIPKRSSGFVLQTTYDPFSEPPPILDELPHKSTPRKSDTLSVPDFNLSSPSKPVLKRFSPMTGDSAALDTKYDVRSARGGRGGKVTSIAAIWQSLATKDEHVPAPPKVNIAPGEIPRIAPPIKFSSPVKRTLRPERHDNVSANDLSNRHGRMAKAPSVPAVISSSLATPVLSSTASLARPIPSESQKYSNIVAPTQDHSTAYTPKSLSNGDFAFGQARLKDLIRKYQQGLGQ